MTNQEAEVKLKINSREALEKITKLEGEAERLRKKFNECFKKGDTRGLADVTRDLNKVNKEIQGMRTNAANIQAAMKRIDEASPRDLQRTLKMINTELNSGRVPRGSKEWKEYCEQIKRVKRELAEVNDEMNDQGGLLDKLKDKFNDWGAAAAAGIAAFAGVVMSGKEAVQAYADMEAEEANVRKFTGMTAEEVKELNEAFKKIDTRTSREELNQLAQEAGRLGKQSLEDVLGFVKAANQINVALDDLGEGATLTLSKLTGIFGDEARLGTERSLLAVGSVINELSQNCTASAPYLSDFSKRLAGVGAQAGLTIPQIMAFAAVLDTQGQAVEMSATAFSQLILKLYKDPAKFAKTARLDVKEFSDLLKKDANEAVLTLLEALGKMGNIEALAPIFKEMGMDGARASGVMAALAGNIDFVRQQQVEANKAFNEAISVTNEYDVQNSTVQAGLDKAKKKFNEMAISLGEKLVPVMRYAISGSSMLMRTISALVEFLIKWKGVIVPLTAAIATYYLKIGLATAAVKLHNAWIVATSAAQKAWMAIQYLSAAAAAAFTGKVNRANIAMAKFNALTKMSPLGLALGILAAAITAMTMFAKRTSDASRAQEVLKKAEADAAVNARKEMAETEALYKKTQDLNASMDSRIKAANKLKELHKDTFENLSAEAIVAGQAAEAYQLLADNIMKSALASAYRDKLSKNAEGLANAEIAREEVLKALLRYSDISSLIDVNDPEESIKRLQEWVKQRNDSNTDVFAYRPGGTTSNSENIRNMVNRLVRLQQSIDDYNDTASKLSDKITSIESSIETPEIVTPDPTSQTAPTTPEKESERKKRMKAELDEQKALMEKEEALNLINYVTGEKNYEQYIAKKKDIDMGLIDKQIEILEKYGETDSKAYADLLLERSKLQKKWADESKAESLADIEREYEERKDFIVDAYCDTNSAIYLKDQAYKLAMNVAEIKYLQKKLELYKDNAKERAKIERKINDIIHKDQETRAKEFMDKRKSFEDKYLGDKMSAYKKTLAEIDKLEMEGVISSEEATKAKMQELSNFLSSIGQDFSASLVNLTETIYSVINDLGGGMTDIFTAGLGVMTAAFSQYTSYMNAERDLELAQIEKRYDKEIEAAGKNTKKKEALEKEKEAEIAKTKKKYNDRAMKIEIAQAIAQTAQAAIAAYSSAAAIPVTGWIMAPIAAALATAAGMMQVATIKKQHEAQSAGYYEGGFTGGKKYKREAGVVHEGEFVANHQAVNNTQLSPLFRLLDYAQRNNTVGSLTAEDVSNALGQGRGVSARGEVASASVPSTVVNNTIDSEPLNRLNQILENGIEAVTILDGERGLHKRYTDFQRMINNPKR